MQISWFLPLALLCVAEAARKPTPPPKPKASGGDLTDECPESNGFFADGYQCDKYYECRDGAIEEKLCPDGMVFNDYSPQVEKCDLPFNIDCSERSERQTPKPSPHCPRQNGYFAHEDPGVCDKFYFCVDGKYNMITCPSGLVYNEKTGICTWPDEAKKKGCSSEGSQVRQKRLTFWPKKEHEEYGSQEISDEQKKQDRSSEGSDEYNDYDDVSSNSKNIDYDNASSNPDDKDYHDEGSYGKLEGYYRNGGSQNENRDYGEEDESTFYDEFSTNPEFSDFDVDFEGFGNSKESGDFYDDKNLQRREEQLDGYIREYVAQLNKDPVKASGPMDLGYYEKIAEAAVDKRRLPSVKACHGKLNINDDSISLFNIPDVFKFECPKVDMTQAQQHPRYPDPEDCQFFYVCINGEVPRRNGCKLGQVFNEATGSCDWPRNVPECLDWYKGVLTDEELYALEHPKPRTRSNTTSSRGPQRKHQVRVE